MSAYTSVASAESHAEVFDLGDLVFFTDDGTVLSAEAEGYAVRLTATDERRPDELRKRLRSYLLDPLVGLDPDLAGDPMVAAQAILDRQWDKRRLKWFPLLDRRVNGIDPAHIEAG